MFMRLAMRRNLWSADATPEIAIADREDLLGLKVEAGKQEFQVAVVVRAVK